MAVFTGMVNTSVICPEMLQIRSIRLPHTGIEIDAVRVCVIYHSPLGDDHRSVLLRVFCSLSVSACSASDFVPCPCMCIIGAAEF